MFGIMCDVFCMISEVGFLNVGVNKCCWMGVKFVEGDIYNLLVIYQILLVYVIRIVDDICYFIYQYGWYVCFIQFLWYLYFFIDVIVYMYDLEIVVISVRMRCIDINKAFFFVFCGIENVLIVG